MNNSICNILKQIQRNRKRSIITISVACSLFLFIGMYTATISYTEAALFTLSESIPVEVKISDISGKRQIGLDITSKRVDQLEDTEQITNLVVTAKALGYIGDSNQNEGHPNISITGANTFDAFSSINQEDIKFSNQSFNNFLSKEDSVCIIEENFMVTENIQLGQDIKFPMYQIIYIDDFGGYKAKFIGDVELKVIGSFMYDDTSDFGSNMIVPVNWLRAFIEQNGGTFTFDSASFSMKNSLALNSFKEEVRELGFTEVDVNALERVHGGSLIFYDQIFIDRASSLQANLRIMKQFQLPIMFLMALLNLLVMFLLLRSRRIEIAIASSLGVSRKHIYSQLFVEVGVLNLIGIMLGYIFLVFFLDQIELLSLLLAFICMICIGMIGVIKILFRFDFIQLLTKAD